MNENEICTNLFDATFKIHRKFGPSLLESAYKECLYFEASKSRLFIVKEKPIPLIYEEVK
jgi:GxxExxY protein